MLMTLLGMRLALSLFLCDLLAQARFLPLILAAIDL
jgi:hypothetical protein